jgi:hypothetical protein
MAEALGCPRMLSGHLAPCLEPRKSSRITEEAGARVRRGTEDGTGDGSDGALARTDRFSDPNRGTEPLGPVGGKASYKDPEALHARASSSATTIF